MWLVEGDEGQYQHLLRHLPADSGWTPRRDVVTASAEPTTFHHASNPAESGLVAPEHLRALWPNLATDYSTAVEVPVTLDTLLSEAGRDINWLVLDCLPAADLLQGGGELLTGLDVVLVRVAAGPTSEVDASHEAVDDRLQGAGLICIHTQAERHPALAHALYARDVALLIKEKRGLSRENAQLQAAREAEAQVRAVEATARAEALARCEALEQENAQLLAAKEAEVQTRAVEAKAMAEALAHCEAQQKVQLQRLGHEFDIKLDKLGKAIVSSTQRDIANAVTQIESFTSLQGYMASGELMPTLHGWPVSPDFALLLVQLLEQHSFDAIIEFGSGSSTLLIARTLAHLARKRPQQPRPVHVALEHLEKYYEGTADLLTGAGLRDEVTLVLAPLKPTVVVSGETFAYYGPGDVLTQLAERLGDVPRILAIVDGPPESIGPLARYPALEMLLGAFPSQQGSLLLDDYRRPGEQEIARRWEELLKAGGIEPETTEFPLEKMACLIRFDSSRPTQCPDASRLA